MKKIKLSVFTVTMLAPFLLVWIGWIMTAFSFNVHDVFHSNAFWGVGLIYWFIWLCLIGIVIDELKEPAK
jgi:hypothetical protein